MVENKRVKLQSFIRQMDAGMTFEPDQKSTEESVHEVVNSILNQVYLM